MPNKVELTVAGEKMPGAYRWLVSRGLTDFGPWCLIDSQEQADGFRRELQQETASPNPSPVKDFQPFAWTGANDDVAGFIIRDGVVTSEVVVVHLTWTGRPEHPDYPGMTRYADVWRWLAECVVPEMKYAAENEEAYEQGRGRNWQGG